MRAANPGAELEAIEVDLLLEGVHRRYGFDLRSYSRPSLRRRIRRLAQAQGLPSISALLARVLHEPDQLGVLFQTVGSHPTPLFADPEFFLAVRNQVVPYLKTHPSVRIWCAGCRSGEEVYSLAILLREEGVGSRCRVYASDAHEGLLACAQAGRFALPGEDASQRYRAAGGRGALSDYFAVESGWAVMDPSLRERISFLPHNLATDGSLNEFQLVLCRNVLTYFSRSLHNRAHGRLFESLARFGFLGLGRKESLSLTPHEQSFEELEGSGRLFRRIG